jgi:hypothetical protein
LAAFLERLFQINHPTVVSSKGLATIAGISGVFGRKLDVRFVTPPWLAKS